MPFPREGLLSTFGQPFDDTARPSLPTAAEPASFAPPVDVRQDRAVLTIVFQVGGDDATDLRVEASGRNIFLWGPLLPGSDDDPGRRAMRVFALPFEVSSRDLHTHRMGDLLRVRVAKKLGQMTRTPSVEAA